MKKTFLLLAVAALCGTGCHTRVGRWYKSQDYMPDSFGYENYRDRQLHQGDHGFNLNWNLKPD
jgi:hypothetical protein